MNTTNEIRRQKFDAVPMRYGIAMGATIVIGVMIVNVINDRVFGVVQPADVKKSVVELDAKVEALSTILLQVIDTKTRDRFFRSEFQSFLDNNPQLQPPDEWEKEID